MEWFKTPKISPASIIRIAQEANTTPLCVNGLWSLLNEIAYSAKELGQITTPEGVPLDAVGLAKLGGVKRKLIEDLLSAFVRCVLLECVGTTYRLSLTVETVSPSALRMRRHRERNKERNSDAPCDDEVTSHASSSSCTSSSVTEGEGVTGEGKLPSVTKWEGSTHECADESPALLLFLESVQVKPGNIPEEVRLKFKRLHGQYGSVWDYTCEETLLRAHGTTQERINYFIKVARSAKEQAASKSSEQDAARIW